MVAIKSRDTIIINGHIVQLPTKIVMTSDPSLISPPGQIREKTVYCVFEVNNLIIVNFNPGTEEDIRALEIYEASHPEYSSNRNVWAFDANGNKIWEIEAIREATILGQSAPYTALKIRDEKIYAFNWVGYDCEIDPLTGKILSKEYYR